MIKSNFAILGENINNFYLDSMFFQRFFLYLKKIVCSYNQPRHGEAIFRLLYINIIKTSVGHGKLCITD